MKAISIKEPWASMILEGKKTIETRKWATKHRGSILLCASKNPKSGISGKAFAVAELIDVRPMTREDEKRACCGVYGGAYSWVLGGVKKIKPFDVKGQLGLFNIAYEENLKMKQFISEKDLDYLAGKDVSAKMREFKIFYTRDTLKDHQITEETLDLGSVFADNFEMFKKNLAKVLSRGNSKFGGVVTRVDVLMRPKNDKFVDIYDVEGGVEYGLEYMRQRQDYIFR